MVGPSKSRPPMSHRKTDLGILRPKKSAKVVLGDNRAILLAHHGRLVATSTIEEAAVLAVFIERAARMQVLAQSIGSIKPIDPACAREAHDYRLKPRAVAATFHYFARRLLKQERDVLE